MEEGFSPPGTAMVVPTLREGVTGVCKIEVNPDFLWRWSSGAVVSLVVLLIVVGKDLRLPTELKKFPVKEGVDSFATRLTSDALSTPVSSVESSAMESIWISWMGLLLPTDGVPVGLPLNILVGELSLPWWMLTGNEGRWAWPASLWSRMWWWWW